MVHLQYPLPFIHLHCSCQFDEICGDMLPEDPPTVLIVLMGTYIPFNQTVLTTT